MMLVHFAQGVQQIALLGVLHAGRPAQVQHRVAAGPKGCALVSRRKEALPENGGAGANSAFEEDHEPWKILILGPETVEYPRAQAGAANPGPAVMDQKLRLRVRETLVIAGANYREFVGLPRRVREQIGDFQAGLAEFLESPFGSENRGLGQFAV